MDVLGRYYTNNVVSNLLVNTIESKSPQKVLDLGVGDASLSIAAYTRWADAKFYGTEIEVGKVKAIEKKLSFLNIYNFDSLHPNLSRKLKIKFETIDVAICNPPYTKVKNCHDYSSLFKSINCPEFLALKNVTSEIVFFAHNLNFLRPGGELGIILSDSLITGKEYRLFREKILSNFEVKRIIQLPDKIFRKTEARTHIVFLSKNIPVQTHTALYSADMHGSLSEKLLIPKEKLYNRMDFHFYSTCTLDYNGYKTLKDIGCEITRGKITYKDLRSSSVPYLHSVHLKDNFQTFNFSKTKKQFEPKSVASSGDIIICRVGKRCVGRIGFIKVGKIVISDCLLKISIPKQYRQVVWNSFLSKEGQIWLKAHAHGICSLVLSKCDLENFPLFYFHSKKNNRDNGS